MSVRKSRKKLHYKHRYSLSVLQFVFVLEISKQSPSSGYRFVCSTYIVKVCYNTDFVRRNTHSNTDSNTQINSGPVTTATIPYITCILQPYNIRVAHKPITTLRRLLTDVKDKDKSEDRQGAVYKIKCRDCQASYIGETGTNLSTRLTEHKLNELRRMVTSTITLLSTF